MLFPQTKLKLTLPTMACAALLLAACDSSTPDLISGGGAGDEDSSPAVIAAIALLTPYAGIYDLQDEWNGISGDEAFLVIEIPGSDGIAPAALYDFDDISNCVPQSPLAEGIVSKDLLSDRVFMDEIFQFEQAELFLEGSTLTIEFNDDADFDNDGSTLDRFSVTASSDAGFSLVSDLGATCT